MSAFWTKIGTVNCDDLGRGFLPGCYTSLTRENFDGRLHRPCAYPYVYNHLIAADAHNADEPQWLYSFRGNIAHVPVREALFRHLAGQPCGALKAVGTRFHSHSEAEKRAYIGDVLNSKFVLCPRGAGPATYRMFEVMELGRCPVIISDDWIPIEHVRWRGCAIVISEREIPRIPQLLRERERQWRELGMNARRAWEKHFSPRAKFRAMYDAIEEVHTHLAQRPLDYRARWASWSFYRANGWLVHQRALHRLKRRLTA